jgi:Domain of unknown function (DUF4845)
MEPYRSEGRLSGWPRQRRQAGITVIGFLLLAIVFGVIGLAVIKIVPLYLEKMRITKALNDVQTTLASGGNSIQGIRDTLEKRLIVESLSDIPRDQILVARDGEGFSLRVKRESRASFLADLWFVVDIDEKVEISR